MPKVRKHNPRPCCERLRLRLEERRLVHLMGLDNLTCRKDSLGGQNSIYKENRTFWAEAINTVAYLINQSASVPLDHELPEER